MTFESKHKQKLEKSSGNGIQQSCQGITFKDISNNRQSNNGIGISYIAENSKDKQFK